MRFFFRFRENGESAVDTPVGELSLAPLETSPKASTPPTIVNHTVALFANTSPATDTIVRPDALGTTTLLELRSSNAPHSFSWEVGLGPNEQLERLPDGNVAVTEAPEGGQPEPAGATSATAAEPESTETGEGAPETAAEASEREEEESQPESEEEVPPEAPPASPQTSTPPGEAPPGGLEPQDTQAQYETATTSMAAAETQTGGTTLMVIEPPSVIDAAGKSVPASLTVLGDTLTLTVRPDPGAPFPVTAAMTVAAPSDKTSAARDPLEYGLSEQHHATFEGFDPNLESKSAHLHVATARIFVPYDLVVTRNETREKSLQTTERATQQEEIAHKHRAELDVPPTQKENLNKWLAAVQHDGLSPYVTFKEDRFVEQRCENHERGCVAPSTNEYRAAIKKLIKDYHKKGVSLWGAWNEPDLGGDPLHKDMARAAQFWEIAKSVVSEKNLHCGACKVVAGEFAFAEGWNKSIHSVSCYRSTILHQHCPGVKHKSKVFWTGPKPRIWGMHDYSDVLGRDPAEAAPHDRDVAEKFAEFTAGPLGSPHLWIGEAGVLLRVVGTKTSLANGGSEAEQEQRQTEAAEDLLTLHLAKSKSDKASRYERIYYYEYQPDTETDVFDSALLKANGYARPAYCVLAFESEKCPPATPATNGPCVVTGGATGETDHLKGFVNPDGHLTEYRFEWGDTPEPYANTSPWKPAGAGVRQIPVEAEVFLANFPDIGKANPYGHYRVVVKDGSTTTASADEELRVCAGA